ncbi:MAG TPA: quinone oxidoreductase [Sphingomonadales bacterium]
MALVARVHETGSPDVIRFEEVDVPPPRGTEVRVRHTAIGVNFIDTYHRRGIYPVSLPTGLGVEAAGVVEAVGEGVTRFKPGDRVVTFGPDIGSYATERVLDEFLWFPIPDDISDEVAAAAFLKACTAEFLVERCAKVEPGSPVLVHAAAGGLGLLLVQWLKAVGAVVIGTVSTPAKAEAARAAGADHIILYTEEDTAARVREITGGAGVRVVFDGVGKATWDASIDSCGVRGLIVVYGNADAPTGPVDMGPLARKGSLFHTRPALYHYYAEPVERAAGAARVWDMLRSGKLSVTIGQRYALRDAARAHADLEGRRTTGSSILLP